MEKNKKYRKIIFILILLNIGVSINLIFIRNKFILEKKNTKIENAEQKDTFTCLLKKINDLDEVEDIYTITYNKKEEKVLYCERMYSIKCNTKEEFESLKKMNVNNGTKAIKEEEQVVTFIYDKKEIFNDKNELLKFQTLKLALEKEGYNCK